jgi:hypothetical protein
MRIGNGIRVASMVTALAIFAGVSAAQDTSQSTSLGEIARKARAQNADAPRAGKVITNDDFGPHLEPVRDDEDPADAVNKAHAALLADTAHVCREEITNNSGPGSTIESVREVAGSNRFHIVTDRQGGPNPGHDEFIVIGSDAYYRNSAGPWQKTEQGKFPAPIGGTGGPEAIWKTYSPGTPAQGPWGTSLSLVRKETAHGVSSFFYEEKFHPGGVSVRTQTDDVWVGANDHLPRKAETLLIESAPGTAPIIQRDTMTCSYGPVPEIKPPM